MPATDTHAQVWILTRGDYCDPTTTLAVFTDPDIARAAFTWHALSFPWIDKLTEAENGAMRLESGADFLALDPHTTTTQAPRPVVSYLGHAHEVLWLGVSDRDELVVEIRPGGRSGVRQTVRVGDLDFDETGSLR